MKPARLAEPGERFVVIGNTNMPSRNGATGTANGYIDAGRIDGLKGYAGPFMAVTYDDVEPPANRAGFATCARWLYALDGDEPVSVEEDEGMEA